MLVGVDDIDSRRAVYASQAGVERIIEYYRAMGSDPTVVEAMIKRDDRNHYRFSGEELKRANVATKVRA